MIKVVTPATTANLGPGFDCLGMALDIYNTFYFEKANEFELINVLEKYKKNNLLVKSYCEAFRYKNEEIIPAKITFLTDIPSSRGLGSSASLIVAGILGANEFLINKLSTDEILALGTSIEGHPDNITPCLLGGLTASFVDTKVNYVKYEVSEKIKLVALIPDFELNTEISRNALPYKYQRKDVVFNISRAINIPYAFLKGDKELLLKVLDDVIHQPYRFPLIDGSKYYIEYAKKNGIPLVISGAGPTLLMISDQEIIVEEKDGFKAVAMHASKGAYVTNGE